MASYEQLITFEHADSPAPLVGPAGSALVSGDHCFLPPDARGWSSELFSHSQLWFSTPPASTFLSPPEGNRQ